MWFVFALLTGCDALSLDDSAPRNCQVRQAYWPDANGDGIGEPTDVLVACEAPDGWVLAPDTGEPVETGTP